MPEGRGVATASTQASPFSDQPSSCGQVEPDYSASTDHCIGNLANKTQALEGVILSFVDGGPISRLAAHLSESQVNCSVYAGANASSYRKLMAASFVTRLAARANGYVVFPLKALVELTQRKGFCIVTTNPFFMPWLCTLSRPLHGCKVVGLVYDLFPDALEATGSARSRHLTRLLEAMNRFWFTRADAVVFIGDSMADHAVRRYGAPKRYRVIGTGADTQEFERMQTVRLDEDHALREWCKGKQIISYVGNMGQVHDWDTIAEALPKVLRDNPRAAAVVAASGPGEAFLRDKWRGLPQHQVRFTGPLPDAAWARLLTSSSVSMVSLSTEAQNTSVPSKTFSAMAAGAAILAVAPPQSDLAKTVERHGCGATVAPGQVTKFVSELNSLLNGPDRLSNAQAAARTSAQDFYSLTALSKIWRELLASL